MDISVGSSVVKQPHTEHTRHTRMLIAIVGGLFVCGVLIALGALLNIAGKLNDEEIQKNTFYAQKALENRMAASRSYITSYAIWTSAYQHLGGKDDTEWAYTQQNMGKTMFTNDGYEGVFVLRADSTTYAVVRGQQVFKPAQDFIAAPIDRLVAQVQSQKVVTEPLSIYTLFEGWPAILSASAILPNDDNLSIDPASTAVLVFVDQLTTSKLRVLGRNYDLQNLHLHDDKTPADHPMRVPLDSTGFSLSWQPDKPGHQLLSSVLPPLGATVVILALLFGYFFRYALRSSRQIDLNVEELESSTRALETSEERFRAVAEAASDWIWEIDELNRITYLSTRFSEVTGFANERWEGQDIETLLSCETTSLNLWLQALNDGQNLSNLRCAYRDSGHHLRYCRVSARPILSHQRVTGYRGTATDITDEVAAHAQIQHLSLHDALTSLPNRTKLSRYLNDALEQNEPLTLLMLDLDNFKPINDSVGHAAGDAVLLEVATRLRGSTRDVDMVARLGGDEFVLVLSAMQIHSEIEHFCERLIHKLHQPIEYENHTLQIGASIGIAQSSAIERDPGELLRCADIALYQAKADGKNTWRFFAPEMNQQIQQRRQLETDLRQALQKQQFVLHYQPRYTVNGSTIVSVEALIRWQHPTQGLLAPDSFIPLAEQTDLIVPLSRWVLEEACRTALDWPDNIMVSVNLSPAQFTRSDVVKDVRDILIATQFPASRLELEITENVMLNDVDGALATMTALKELGVRLNMDDFGTGYSSLGYLRTYPFDGIKIDKRFIASMSNSSNDRAVVQAIINLGKAMGLTVTAEGVETAQQLQVLGNDECHEVQGYFLSRPIDKDAFERLLKNRGAPTEERLSADAAGRIL